jgi:hypothetical protein
VAQAVSYTELKRRAKAAADMTYSDFWDSTQWLDQINSSVRKLYNKLVEADQDFYTVARYIELDGTNTIFRLPSDFYKLKGVDYELNGLTRQMRSYSFSERSLFSDVAPSQQITLWVVPTFGGFLDENPDTEEFDGINGWEEWVILDAAIQALIAEESDASALMTERGIIEASIESMKAARDIGEPERVRDVTEERDGLPEERLAYRVVGNQIHIGQRTSGSLWA